MNIINMNYLSKVRDRKKRPEKFSWIHFSISQNLKFSLQKNQMMKDVSKKPTNLSFLMTTLSSLNISNPDRMRVKISFWNKVFINEQNFSIKSKFFND